MTDASPFHPGEIALQERFDARSVEVFARKAIRPFMPDQHRNFFEALPFLVLAARDTRGRPFATILEGAPGFIASPEATGLEIGAVPAPGDALEGALDSGADIGLLGIELASRRRNRVNGVLTAAGADGLRFAVGQSFGNCPQYIRARGWHWSDAVPVASATRLAELTEAQRDWIARADTFFIASGYRGEGSHAGHGMDASHRGGEPGFVEVLDDRRIRFPDYAGNSHYNTLGNILLDPRAGFLFVDFAGGHLLQITGRASIDWTAETLARFPGARQLVTLEIDEIVEVCDALRLRWDAEADAVRTLRLVSRQRESADVTSFVFEALNGGRLPRFRAGQHLPIDLSLPGGVHVQRSYSLSGSPEKRGYRISVKREAQGLVSRLLHDVLRPGGMIRARNPSGGFVLPEPGPAPLFLASAGVGITPMIAMLHALAVRGDRREIRFVHGARDGDHHPFRDEVRSLIEALPNARALTLYSRPGPNDIQGRDFDQKGRVSARTLAGAERRAEALHFLCGPAGFLADLTTGLEDAGVPGARIFQENF